MPPSILNAWPDGVPPLERLLWESLDDGRRLLATRRMSALLRYESGGDWRLAADEAGLSRPGFFSMLRRWRTGRSLAAVVPGLRPPRGRSPGMSVGDDARDVLAVLVERHPDWPRSRLVSSARDMLDDPPSAGALRPVVDALRAAAEAERLGGRAAFGRSVLVASAPASAPGETDSDAEIEAFVGLVVDRATRLVLGSGVGGDQFDALRDAAADAAARLADPGGGAAGPEPEVRVSIEGTVDPVRTLREMARLEGLGFRDVVRIEGMGRGRASELRRVVGTSLGPVRLRPRLASVNTVGLEEMRALQLSLSTEVERRLADAGGIGRSSSSTVALREALLRLAGRGHADATGSSVSDA